jgi:hypothetical protein
MFNSVKRRDYILTAQGARDAIECIELVKDKKGKLLNSSNWTVMFFLKVLFYTNNQFWLPTSIFPTPPVNPKKKQPPEDAKKIRRSSASGMIRRFAMFTQLLVKKQEPTSANSNFSYNVWKLARSPGNNYNTEAHIRLQLFRVWEERKKDANKDANKTKTQNCNQNEPEDANKTKTQNCNQNEPEDENEKNRANEVLKRTETKTKQKGKPTGTKRKNKISI